MKITKDYENWREIPNYDGRYYVSNIGCVKSVERKKWNGNGWQTVKGKILKNQINSNGYYVVNLCKQGIQKTVKVHRLVAQAFLTNYDENLQVNHKDGNKLNNNIINIEMCTPSENMKHSINVLNNNKPPIPKKETKKMTVSEICKELGYDVEIVKENENE